MEGAKEQYGVDGSADFVHKIDRAHPLIGVCIYYKVMKAILSVVLPLLPLIGVQAQEDPIYRMEMGVGVGIVSYEGDFNGNILKGAQPMGGIVIRRTFNPYMGLRLTVAAGKLKGSSANAKTYYPAYATTPHHFNRTLADVSLAYEYNFWPYGTGRDYRGAQRLTPFLFGGIGATSVSGGQKSVFTANIPLGIGVKYKLGDRVNLGLEWAIHFSLSDELDGVKDPYTVKSSGMFKNKDCYSALMLSLTYSFMPKCKTCNKDD